MEIPEVPQNLPKTLKAYLEILRAAAMQAQPIAGHNVTVGQPTETGTVINADDCTE
jgi:hypothetical protein